MKPLKIFVALAALMTMAFVGTSSAVAESTVLCDTDTGSEACPAGHLVTHFHETSVGKAALLAEPKVECNVLFLGDVVESSPLVIQGAFTYSNCGAGCSVEEEGGPSVIEVLKEGHETAKVTGEGEVHVNCSGIDCFYDGEELLATAKGPLLAKKNEKGEVENPNGEVSIQGQTIKKVSGTFCPSFGQLDIVTTPLAAVYVVTGTYGTLSTALCGADPGTGIQEKCPAGHIVTHVHEVSVGKAKLLASPEVQCNVLFLGSTSGLGAPLVIEGNFTYSSCGASCSVTEEGGPSVIKVFKPGHETASMVGEGEVHVNCFGINCYYNGEELLGTAKGPLLAANANGEVSIQSQTIKKVKGTFCPSTGKLDIVTTPLSLTYITN